MNKFNSDVLIALYAEYVQILEKEIAANKEFLNQHGRPVNLTDPIVVAKLVAEIKASREVIPTTEAKELLAKAATKALAEVERQAKAEVIELAKETAKAKREADKQAKTEIVELAKEAKVASNKLAADAKIAASKL